MAVWTLVVALPARASGSEGSILLGAVTRPEVEEAMPGWVSEAMAVEPDLEAADRLLQAIVGAEVVVYLGTWCDDTRRELARLWWALDSLGVDAPPELSYVAVDRSMTEPADQVAGVDLIRVPTIVVKRGGKRVGPDRGRVAPWNRDRSPRPADRGGQRYHHCQRGSLDRGGRLPALSQSAGAGRETVKNLGWGLQFLALVVVGCALFLGLAYESMAAELSLLGLGILLFMLGKRLQDPDG